ncbi:MAG: hypothetical protein WC756_10385 [Taibaiella sp.]|jgi:hypothetical protein
MPTKIEILNKLNVQVVSTLLNEEINKKSKNSPFYTLILLFIQNKEPNLKQIQEFDEWKKTFNVLINIDQGVGIHQRLPENIRNQATNNYWLIQLVIGPFKEWVEKQVSEYARLGEDYEHVPSLGTNNNEALSRNSSTHSLSNVSNKIVDAERQKKVDQIVLLASAAEIAQNNNQIKSINGLTAQIYKFKVELKRNNGEKLSRVEFNDTYKTVVGDQRADLCWDICNNAMIQPKITIPTKEQLDKRLADEKQVEEEIKSAVDSLSSALKTYDIPEKFFTDKNITNEEKLYQFASKIYGNDPLEIKQEIKLNISKEFGSILTENPAAAVAILLKACANYKQYLVENDGEGSYKWEETNKLMVILADKTKAPGDKLTEANGVLSNKGEILSKARNPFSFFINVWAWIMHKMTSSATNTVGTRVWDVASSQSTGAGFVKEATNVIEAATPKKNS